MLNQNPYYVGCNINLEIRMKEQQQCLFVDRNSTSWIRANQLRLYVSAFADVLLYASRRRALRTRHEQAQCSTLRVRFLNIAARIHITTSRCGCRCRSTIRGSTTLRRRCSSFAHCRAVHHRFERLATRIHRLISHPGTRSSPDRGVAHP